MSRTNIVISGEGGQGVQTIAQIFSKSLVAKGLEVVSIPSFGVEQRGTPSTTYLSVADSVLRQAAFDKADIIVVISQRSVAHIFSYLSGGVKVLFDSSTVTASSLGSRTELFGIPAAKIAQTHFAPKSANMIILGALAKMFDLDFELVWSEAQAKLKNKFKTAETEKENKDALRYGYDAALETKSFSRADFRPKQKALMFRNATKAAEIVPSRCKGCGICIAKCPVSALSFGEDLGVFSTPVPEIDLEKCIACGNCLQFCPDGAIRVQKLK